MASPMLSSRTAATEAGLNPDAGGAPAGPLLRPLRFEVAPVLAHVALSQELDEALYVGVHAVHRALALPLQA